MTQIEEVKTKVAQTITDTSFEIATPQDYERASLILKNTRQLLKYIDQKEKEVTRPLNEGLKKARALFKPWKMKVNEVIIKLNSSLNAYARKQREEAAKKQAELDKQTNPDDLFKPIAEPEIPEVLKTRKIWKWRLKDKGKMKFDYLVPDEKTINELVRKLKDKAEKIIGEGSIEVFYEETHF